MISAPPLAASEIHIWPIPLCASAQIASACTAVLSPDERRRAAALHSPEHRLYFSLARGRLRILLGAYLGKSPADLRFTYGPCGKPELADSPLHFNLSHCGERAMVAVSSEPVGIDLEEIRLLDFAAVGSTTFSADELAGVASAVANERSRLFFQFWTRREARLKAMGEGIANPEARIPPGIRAHDLDPGPRFCAAVATAIQLPHIRWMDSAALPDSL